MSSSSKRKDRKSSNARKRENQGKSLKVQQHSEIAESGANEQPENDIVVLKVGENTVSVKKEILIATSEYFKAKFAGHFCDSNAKELDLTKDVEEIEDLIMLIDFTRNRKVDISEDNVCRILKVSSFFLVDSLTDYCAEFMSDSTCLTNCLQYYIAALNFSLPEHITRKFESLIRARFHDLIIFEDFAAEYINDEELRMLSSSNVLQYCSRENLFNFLLKWLSKSPELTASQYKVTSDVIQFFEQCEFKQNIPFQCDKKKAIANLNRVTDTIRKSRDQELLQNFQQLFTNFLRNKELVFLHTSFHSSETCVAIFTISKRVSVNRTCAEGRRTHSPKCSFYMPSESLNELFDICVYHPDSRVWFHITTLPEDRYFNLVDGRPYKTNTQLRRKFPVSIFCNIEATGNEVLLCDVSNRSNFLRLDFESRKWSNFNMKHVIRNYEAHQWVKGKNGITYFVTSMVIPNGSLNNGLLDYTKFHCYTFDFHQQSSIPVCKLLFSTMRFTAERSNAHSHWCKMKVKYSSVSDEMLILYSKTGVEESATVIDLTPLEKDGKPTYYNLLHRDVKDFKNDTDLLFVDVDILEIGDSFLVISSANNLLTLKFRYKLRSRELTKVDDGWQYTFPNICNFLPENWHHLLYKDFCWEMSEECEHVNKVRKVRFSESGVADVEDHTPPPFVKPVAACVTEVRQSLFSSLEPVRNFLEFPKIMTKH